MATTGGDPARRGVQRESLGTPTRLAMVTVAVNGVIVAGYLTLDPAGPSNRRLVNAALVVGLTVVAVASSRTRSALATSALSISAGSGLVALGMVSGSLFLSPLYLVGLANGLNRHAMIDEQFERTTRFLFLAGIAVLTAAGVTASTTVAW